MTSLLPTGTGAGRRTAGTGLWLVTGLTLILLLTRNLLPGVLFPALLLAQTAFTFLHGARRYGPRAILVFYAVTLVVSNALENLSISTGFPFGHYHYTQGPQLLQVPLMIGPAYAVTGYLAWTVATLLVGEVRPGADRLTTVGTPVVASFAMVAWDLSMDPTLATVRKMWIWENGGGFFGVPLVNFLGWSLTTYAFLQLFALYLRRRGPRAEPGPASPAQPLVLYAGTAATFLLTYVTGERTTVTDAAGHTWRSADIYETSALTTIYGMLFIALLAALALARRRARRE
ncbi:carotenoid biosynthesis protein [Actinomadura sp. ATCC 31491]|uniref:Carotenoid biosynthesis protein n=1 Tax=Actinomadura luzonensis TaxID=2805427 RepID=A0ABT0G3I1_9ACTN|nr:carotenoid biosynthesis protein [Actinomadura luzonensis]MCK2218686.1 carotenoid biosynthesis protein [Actinomadura luzonensis]